jgi:hypothetical protein
MAPEPQSRGPIVAVVALLGLSGLGALGVLLKGGSGSAQTPKPNGGLARASRAWPDEAAPRVQDPAMLRPDAERSGLDMVGRPDDATSPQMPGTEGSSPSAGAAPQAAADAPPEGVPGKGAVVELSASEKAALAKAAGRDMEDPKKAAEVAGSDGPWSSLLGAVAKSSRIVGFLLNNETVVKAFMSRPTAQKYCRSASAYTGYLTNTKAPGGVNHAMNVFEKVLHANPENPTVMFSSKFGAAITDCPSVQSIVKDNSAIHAIATGNPRAVSMLMDPALMKGLAANPTAMGAFGGIQASLTGGKKDSR